MVLKCDQGFVGYKSSSSLRLECNKASYETIQVERSDRGIVFFKGIIVFIWHKSLLLYIVFFSGQTNKYWHANDEGVSVESDVPEGFFIELREPTRICIKSVSGYYLSAGKNGMFRLGDGDYSNATKWEY